jgi:hypothetical protein
MLDGDLEVSGEEALAQPSRARLFGLLVELKRAASSQPVSEASNARGGRSVVSSLPMTLILDSTRCDERWSRSASRPTSSPGEVTV